MIYCSIDPIASSGIDENLEKQGEVEGKRENTEFQIRNFEDFREQTADGLQTGKGGKRRKEGEGIREEE